MEINESLESPVIVTGASGFVGRAVLSQLAANKRSYLALSRVPVAGHERFWHEYSLEHPILPDIPLENSVVVHLAWHGIPNLSEELSRWNELATMRVCKQFLHAGIRRIILAGSCLEYGERKGRVTEDTPPGPLQPFGRIKRELFEKVEQIAKPFSTQILATRIFYAFGVGQRSDALLPSIVRNLQEKRTPNLRNPLSAHDFIEISDVAAGIEMLASLKHVPSGVYNIGQGKLEYVQTLAKLAAEALGFEIPQPPTGGEPSEEECGLVADTAKLQALGWSPKMSLLRGIQRYLSSMK